MSFSVALITHIHLAANRPDLAAREVAAAKRWAQDSVLANLAEAWVGLRTGGPAYEAAGYVFEELAAVTSTASAMSVVGHAVAELHLGRLPEAQAALLAAVDAHPRDEHVLAGAVVA
ncbi:hypothetical protein KEM52_004798, partial [Ascosphaera acerosa]